jgi:CDP-diacylglycerol--serine O-phosphatidyltransferase
MISKIPTYSLKGLKIKKPYLVLMLLTIGTYFSLLINYPFNTLLFTGLLYIAFIPISFVHFKLIKKRTSKNSQNFISEDLI